MCSGCTLESERLSETFRFSLCLGFDPNNVRFFFPIQILLVSKSNESEVSLLALNFISKGFLKQFLLVFSGFFFLFLLFLTLPFFMFRISVCMHP